VLLGHMGGGWTIARIIGWAFALWGTGLYWWAGILYVRQAIHLVQTLPPLSSQQPASTSGSASVHRK